MWYYKWEDQRDYAQYWQGAGAEDSDVMQVGIGDTLDEAIDDAVTTLAQSATHKEDWEALTKQIKENYTEEQLSESCYDAAVAGEQEAVAHDEQDAETDQFYFILRGYENKEVDAWLEEDKKAFCKVAWPGCYPVCYVTKDGGTLCPECATENKRLIIHAPKDMDKQWHIIGCRLIEEVEDDICDIIVCDNCNRRLNGNEEQKGDVENETTSTDAGD